jgi:hypothetical protein
MTTSLKVPGFAISMAVSPPSRVAKEPTKCPTRANEASRPVHVFICGMGYVGLRFALSMRWFQAPPMHLSFCHLPDRPAKFQL